METANKTADAKTYQSASNQHSLKSTPRLKPSGRRLQNSWTCRWTRKRDTDQETHVDRPLAKDFGCWVHDEHAQAKSKNEPGSCLGQNFDGDSKLCRNGHEAWSQHWPISSHHGS